MSTDANVVRPQEPKGGWGRATSSEWAAELAWRDREYPPNRVAAETLHDAWCPFSHTDQCGWLIEQGWGEARWHSPRFSAHRQWVDLAIQLRRVGALKRALLTIEDADE